MQEAVAIHNLNGRLIDAHVRVRVDGTVFILKKDDKGGQIRTNYSPFKHNRKFGHFVKLPVKNAKKKTSYIDVAISRMYKKAFPQKSLPICLQKYDVSYYRKALPQQDVTQLPLF